MESEEHTQRKAGTRMAGGLAGWILERFHRAPSATPRLALLERITLAPRQSLALVEAEGRRLLVATSPEGAPTFYALDGHPMPAVKRQPITPKPTGRISW